MPVGQKFDMPKFAIVDHPKAGKYVIVWQENLLPVSRSRKYGVKRSKEETYKEMLDIRYELMITWLEVNKGSKTIGTQWEPQE